MKIKLDGHRAQALSDGDQTRLLSCNGKDLGQRFPALLPGLRGRSTWFDSGRGTGRSRRLSRKLDKHRCLDFLTLAYGVHCDGIGWGLGVAAAAATYSQRHANRKEEKGED